MNSLSPASRRTLLSVFLLALVAAGCRTYGGYGTEDKLLVQIERANERFAEDLERARGDLATLQQAAASHTVLQAFADDYAAVIGVQEAMLEQHRTLADEAAANRGDYRVLNRTYGALVSDRQLIHDRYTEVLDKVAGALGVPASAQVPLQSRYQVAPQYYQRIAHNNARRSLTQILRSGPAAPQVAPDTTSAPAQAN